MSESYDPLIGELSTDKARELTSEDKRVLGEEQMIAHAVMMSS